jgi:hypothetical protein
MLKKQLRLNGLRTKFPKAIEINAVEPLRFDPKPDVALSYSITSSPLALLQLLVNFADRQLAERWHVSGALQLDRPPL